MLVANSRVVLSVLLMLGLASPGWACDAVIVGRAASADGAVLVGHNEENALDRVLEFHKIPRQQPPAGSVVRMQLGGQIEEVPETAAFLWSENPGLRFSDGYLNEWGVAVVSIQCLTREDSYETLVASGEIREGGIGYMLRRLVAQRAKTAREGMELIGRLVERFGYVDSGRTYAVADPNEAWVVEVVRGRRLGRPAGAGRQGRGASRPARDRRGRSGRSRELPGLARSDLLCRFPGMVSSGPGRGV